jgi:hypothetical protein
METLIEYPGTLQELVKTYHDAILAVTKEIEFWYWLNISFQTISVGLGVLATLMMALQNDANHKLTKPIGIVATTLTTGIVTAYSVFHIKENIDKLLAIQTAVVNHTNDLEFYIREHADEKTNLQVEKKYTFILNDLGDQRRRLKGSIGSVSVSGQSTAATPGMATSK